MLRKKLKKTISIFLSMIILFTLIKPFSITANAEEMVKYAKGAILIEASTGKILYARDEHKQLPMASTTKIMTALLTIESGNLDEKFVVDKNAIKVEGTSMGLKEGDSVTKRALCYGMLLSSGNDSANSAAVKVSGSIKNFVNLMNERAVSMGLANTHFETPSGLDGENHYSTAYDMAILAKNALNNPEFVKICSSKSATVEFGNSEYKRTLSNHNRLLKEYDGAIGVKTGFTKKAGRCLVSAATRDGITLICVTLAAGDDWNVHKKLFDYGFSNISLVFLDADLGATELPVTGGDNKTVKFMLKEEPRCVLAEKDKEKVVRRVFLRPFEYAPILIGQKIGEVTYTFEGNIIFKTDIIARSESKLLKDIKKKNLFKRIIDFFAFWS